METSKEIRIIGLPESNECEPIVVGPEPATAVLTEPRVQIEFDPETSTYRIGLAVAL